MTIDKWLYAAATALPAFRYYTQESFVALTLYVAAFLYNWMDCARLDGQRPLGWRRDWHYGTSNREEDERAHVGIRYGRDHRSRDVPCCF